MLRTTLAMCLFADAHGLLASRAVPVQPTVSGRTLRGSPVVAKAEYIPSGPFGGYKTRGEGPEGGGAWIGDRSESLQIEKFEDGEDYLFFQGPTPRTGVQPDLPSFFSFENLAELEITVPQIAVTVTGLGSFLIVLQVLLSDTTLNLPLPSAPAISMSAPTASAPKAAAPKVSSSEAEAKLKEAKAAKESERKARAAAKAEADAKEKADRQEMMQARAASKAQ